MKFSRCKQVELERDKLSYEKNQNVQAKAKQLETEKNNLGIEILNLKQEKSRLYSEFEEKLAANQREIEYLREKNESMKADRGERDHLYKKVEDERKAHEKELDDLKRRLTIQPEFDSQQNFNKSKEKLEKAIAELNKTREELDEAKRR